MDMKKDFTMANIMPTTIMHERAYIKMFDIYLYLHGADAEAPSFKEYEEWFEKIMKYYSDENCDLEFEEGEDYFPCYSSIPISSDGEFEVHSDAFVRDDVAFVILADEDEAFGEFADAVLKMKLVERIAEEEEELAQKQSENVKEILERNKDNNEDNVIYLF